MILLPKHLITYKKLPIGPHNAFSFTANSLTGSYSLLLVIEDMETGSAEPQPLLPNRDK